MKIGVAHSMLMAGTYSKNTDKILKKHGFCDRNLVEHQGPERAAKDLITLIKEVAINKRKELSDKKLPNVRDYDSRNQKMCKEYNII